MTKTKQPGESITIGKHKFRLFEDRIGPALSIQNTYDSNDPTELLHFRSSAFALQAYDGAIALAKTTLETEMKINQNKGENQNG